MIQIIDILDKPYWQSILLEKVNKIKETTHHNASNYLNFHVRLPLYDSFVILVDDDNILAMSGLFNGNIYPQNISRALDRTYYFENKKSRGFNKEYYYASKYMLPYQVEIAKKLNKAAVFVSIQNLNKRKAFLRFCKNSHNLLTPLENLYNTCRQINNTINNDVLCWQNVAIHKIDPNYNLILPQITQNDYRKKYTNITRIR